MFHFSEAGHGGRAGQKADQLNIKVNFKVFKVIFFELKKDQRMKHMQFLKANIVAIAALGIVAGTSAFNMNTTTLSQTYKYTGTSFDHSAVSNPANWKLSAIPTPENCGLANEVTCTIQLPNGFDNGSGELDSSKVQIQTSGSPVEKMVSDVINLQQEELPSILEDQTEGERP